MAQARWQSIDESAALLAVAMTTKSKVMSAYRYSLARLFPTFRLLHKRPFRPIKHTWMIFSFTPSALMLLT
jgi:hypothetical protein